MRYVSTEGSRELEELIRERSERVKEIEVVRLNDTENMTQLLAFIRTAEEPHYHAQHDLTFTVLRGRGELYLDGERYKLSEGDFAFIPKGKVHFYTNTSAVSVLLAVFSPRYDGKDSVKVDL